MVNGYADDWARTCSDRGVHDALGRWATAEPDLASLPLDTIMRQAQGTWPDQHPDRADTVLAALLRLAPTDPLARRTAVQAVLPRLIAVARTLSRRAGAAPAGELTADLVALAWEELGRATGRWPGHHAARLATHVQRRHTRTLRHQLHEHPVADVTLSPGPPTGPGEPGLFAGVDVASLLNAAAARGVLQPLAARILEDVAFHGLTDNQIAASRGATPAAVKKARQRAVIALRTHGPVLGLRAG